MRPGPSFTAVVRDELARVDAADPAERRAELVGLTLTAGRITAAEGGAQLAYVTTSAALARRLLTTLKDGFDARVRIAVRGLRGAPGARAYEVQVVGAAAGRRILQDLGLLDDGGNLRAALPGPARRGRAAAAACLRGLFLGAGHVHPPRRGYHLEILLRHRTLAEDTRSLMLALGLAARLASRRQGHAVYLKDGDQVVRFLTMTGAHAAVLAYEDARIYREVRGQVNRLVNAETANLEKAIGAAVRQVKDIQLVVQELGLDALPPALREIARLRLDHRELSLRELGQQCRPVLSKSAVAHRMRRLQALAAQLRAARAGGGRDGRHRQKLRKGMSSQASEMLT